MVTYKIQQTSRVYLEAPQVFIPASQAIEKGAIFNTAVAAGTNMFSSSLSPSIAASVFRVYAVFTASGVLTVRRTRGGVTVSEQLNAGNALNANAAYIFDVLVKTGDAVNLQYGVAGTTIVLLVFEMPTAC